VAAARAGAAARAAAKARAAIVGRIARDALAVAGLLFGAYLFAVVAPIAKTVGFDAFSYWDYTIADPYRLTHGTMGSFVYSPVAARLFAADSALPWQTFLVIWLGILLATAIWLGGWRGTGWRRWGWLYVLTFPPVAVELYHGNVHLLIAAAIALGFRYPAAWAFVLLTKVTPGVGLLWFAVRREWRSLAIALGVTGVLVVGSLLIDFGLWPQWIDKELLVSLRQPPDQPQLAIPLLIRLPAAALLVIWGARTDRRWTVPASAALAMPVLWFAALAVLVAIPAVERPELRERTEPVEDESPKRPNASPAGATGVPGVPDAAA
jgi:Glycosyltransferase family 87